MVNKEAGDRIRFKLSLADQVGAAFHQNAIPVLNELIVENRLGRDLRDLNERSVQLTMISRDAKKISAHFVSLMVDRRK